MGALPPAFPGRFPARRRHDRTDRRCPHHRPCRHQPGAGLCDGDALQLSVRPAHRSRLCARYRPGRAGPRVLYDVRREPAGPLRAAGAARHQTGWRLLPGLHGLEDLLQPHPGQPRPVGTPPDLGLAGALQRFSDQCAEPQDHPVCHQHLYAGGGARHAAAPAVRLRVVHVLRALGVVQRGGVVGVVGHPATPAAGSPAHR
ncbi:hypothetical protein D3C71_1256640 [compost metagenome]